MASSSLSIIRLMVAISEDLVLFLLGQIGTITISMFFLQIWAGSQNILIKGPLSRFFGGTRIEHLLPEENSWNSLEVSFRKTCTIRRCDSQGFLWVIYCNPHKNHLPGKQAQVGWATHFPKSAMCKNLLLSKLSLLFTVEQGYKDRARFNRI